MRVLDLAPTHPLDRVAFALLVALSCLPFSQVVVIALPGITLFAYDALYLALLAVLVLRMLSSRRLAHPAPLFLFLSAVAVSSAFALARPSAPSVHLMLYQGRYFLPFLIAALFAATATTIPLRALLLALCAGALVSASSALAVNYLFPGFLVKQFSFAEEIGQLAFAQGRLHWTNDSLVFIPFLTAAVLPRLKGWALTLVVVSGFVTAAVSFNRLNRTILAGLAVYLVLLLIGGMVTRRAAAQGVQLAGRVLLVLLLLGGSVFLLVSSSPQLAKAAGERFPTNAEKLQDFLQGDVGQERGPIWGHYLESPAQTFAVGQGLGKPLLFTNTPIYTSDVSYWAFLLVFGLLGLASLAALLLVLFRRLRSRDLPRPPNAWALSALIGVVMFVSLNVDWLSRDNMVIYLTVIVLSATRPAGRERVEHGRSA